MVDTSAAWLKQTSEVLRSRGVGHTSERSCANSSCDELITVKVLVLKAVTRVVINLPSNVIPIRFDVVVGGRILRVMLIHGLMNRRNM